MRKLTTLLFVGLLSIMAKNANAQAISETTISFMKANANAIVATYNVPEDAIENILKQKLDKENLGKSKKSKGYTTFTGVVWAKISQDKMDYYFKVDGKKGQSTITVVVSMDYNSFISSANSPQAVANIKAFLSDFTSGINAYQLSVNVVAQQDVISKAQKEYDRSVSNSNDLIKEKSDLEQKITDSQNNQTQMKANLDAANQKLADLKSKAN